VTHKQISFDDYFYLMSLVMANRQSALQGLKYAIEGNRPEEAARFEAIIARSEIILKQENYPLAWIQYEDGNAFDALFPSPRDYKPNNRMWLVTIPTGTVHPYFLVTGQTVRENSDTYYYNKSKDAPPGLVNMTYDDGNIGYCPTAWLTLVTDEKQIIESQLF